jgi:hypothetical protein
MTLDFVQTLPYDSIPSLVRKAAYGLVTTCILGTAVYAGYRVAAPNKYTINGYRHPELNDKVDKNMSLNISIDLLLIQIEKVLDSLKITDEQLIHIMHVLEEEMSAGTKYSKRHRNGSSTGT